MLVSRGNRAGSDEYVARRTAVDSDRAFKLAMLNARARKLERFTIGVDDRPGTDQPVIMQMRPLPCSGGSSPAAQCADFAQDGRTGSDSY